MNEEDIYDLEAGPGLATQANREKEIMRNSGVWEQLLKNKKKI